MSLKTVTIHQPEHLPWLGFFHKMTIADELILLDNVQFRKNYFQNRNKIRTPTGWQWITVPVCKHPSDERIRNIQIFTEKGWIQKNLSAIKNSYITAPYYESYINELHAIFVCERYSLSNLNIHLITFLKRQLGIDTVLTESSTLINNSQEVGTDLLLSLCKLREADVYLSGRFGKDYLDTAKFEQEKIQVTFQDFHHPTYTQRYEPFIPGMSVIDLLMNYGEKSRDIIRGIL